MTREQLDAIRARVDEATARNWSMEARALADARALLAEVERLTAERDAAYRRGVAAMREAAARHLDHDAHPGSLAAGTAAEVRALPDPEDDR